MKCELKVNKKIIKQLSTKDAIRTLGVYMCPQVQWKDQFKAMKDKMIELIAKLNNTEIKPHLMHPYFNAYLLKKVFFGCGVMKISKQQYKGLRRLYEIPLAKKLQLGSNFPRSALCSRKSTVGIGLINPKTVAVMLACKFYVGNVRAKKDRKK